MDSRDKNIGDSKADRAKSDALKLHHDSNPDAGDLVGEAAGGISGVLAGAAIGSLGGPIGTVIGGIAGAVGGWWTGRAVSEAVEGVTEADDTYYRTHYETDTNRLADRKYDDVRPAYLLGHVASRNPDYSAREWNDVETDLRRGWNDDLKGKHGDWQQVSRYAREGYTRGRSSIGSATRSAANKVGNAVDDMKDRVDGNPASKPGPDATDRR